MNYFSKVRRKEISKFFFYLGIVYFLIGVLVLNGCSAARQADRTVAKQEKKLEKQKIEKEKQAEAQMQMRQQRHFEMQTKAVQKRMKKAHKKAKKHNERKKDYFWKRWFR